MICSKIIHLFPWEFILKQTIIRFFNFNDLINYWKKVIFLKKFILLIH